MTPAASGLTECPWNKYACLQASLSGEQGFGISTTWCYFNSGSFCCCFLAVFTNSSRLSLRERCFLQVFHSAFMAQIMEIPLGYAGARLCASHSYVCLIKCIYFLTTKPWCFQQHRRWNTIVSKLICAMPGLLLRCASVGAFPASVRNFFFSLQLFFSPFLAFLLLPLPPSFPLPLLHLTFCFSRVLAGRI